MDIRKETPADIVTIRDITNAAFEATKGTQSIEARIIDGLRAAGALPLSLVAVQGGEVIGHVAFSPVTIDGVDHGWLGIGPVAVRPDHQSRGVGLALIRAGLAQLRADDAAGCVVLGNPAYYLRFGFAQHTGLTYAHAPAQYFMSQVIAGPPQTGAVSYHSAFDIEAPH